jgi:hypothetical protein
LGGAWGSLGIYDYLFWGDYIDCILLIFIIVYGTLDWKRPIKMKNTNRDNLERPKIN